MKAIIHTFAILKEKLPSQFEIEIGVNNIQAVIDSICTQNPDCSDLLESCRIAVNEEFVDKNFEIEDGTEVYLLPPSSGG